MKKHWRDGIISAQIVLTIKHFFLTRFDEFYKSINEEICPAEFPLFMLYALVIDDRLEYK